MPLKQKEYVTHDELDLWGGEIMRQMDEIRGDVKEIRENMVTKEEAKEFATKEDIKAFATKEDLRGMATKDDLKGLASKEEFERMYLVLDEIRENTKK